VSARLEFSVWWCGDEVCDCVQAQVVRLTPGARAGWAHREIVWQGTFFSGGEGSAEAADELRVEAARRGVRLEEREGWSPQAVVPEDGAGPGRHGGPRDRGAADSYYRRPFRPHWFRGKTYQSEEVTELTPAERAEYACGFCENEESGNYKEE
jgi:hypothetical protein